MTSDPSPEPDPRKKRALMIGGAIVVAAIAWNSDGWLGGDDHVSVTVVGDDDASDAIRGEVRDTVRAAIRGDYSADEESADEPADSALAAKGEEEAAPETVSVAETGERRLVETESGANQRSFRIEGDDGRGVTISVDTAN